jgi:hypothetical protein
MPTPTVINKYRYSDVINRRYWDKYFFSNMSVNPVITQLGGAAAAGGSAEVDVWTDSKSIFEQFIIVGNAKIGPKLDGSYGLDLSTTATSTHGVEYGTGVTPQNNFTFLIDTTGATTPAFFLRGRFVVATANGCTLELGFRKLAAYNATLSSYTDFAAFGDIAGEFESQTQIASGGVVTTDSTVAAVNATEFEIAVKVDAFGNVTYELDGVAPPTVAAYQFANGLTVIPFLRIIQNATTTATASCAYFECGFQS